MKSRTRKKDGWGKPGVFCWMGEGRRMGVQCTRYGSRSKAAQPGASSRVRTRRPHRACIVICMNLGLLGLQGGVGGWPDREGRTLEVDFSHGGFWPSTKVRYFGRVVAFAVGLLCLMARSRLLHLVFSVGPARSEWVGGGIVSMTNATLQSASWVLHLVWTGHLGPSHRQHQRTTARWVANSTRKAGAGAGDAGAGAAAGPLCFALSAVAPVEST